MPVYRTVPAAPDKGAELRRLLDDDGLDVALFTSSSTVENVADLLGPDAPARLARTTVASIGPVTTETARAEGIRVDAEASPYTLAALVSALEATFLREG